MPICTTCATPRPRESCTWRNLVPPASSGTASACWSRGRRWLPFRAWKTWWMNDRRLHTSLYGAYVGFEIGHRGAAVDAMIQIDDVPSAAAGLDATPGRERHLLWRGRPQHFFIHIPLKDQV